MSVVMLLRLFAAASVLCGSLQDVELAFPLQILATPMIPVLPMWNHYASILPTASLELPSTNSLLPTAEPAFEQTLRVNLADPSFELLSKAAFVVYNKKRRLPLLGANARNEHV